MTRPGYILFVGFATALLMHGCKSKPTGPDQILLVPSADWKITDHDPGDVTNAQWSLESKGTIVELFSVDTAKGPKDAIDHIAKFRQYLTASATDLPILSHYWTTGDYKYTRQYAPTDQQNVDQGSAYVLAEKGDHVYAFTFVNPKMKREEISDLADKASVEFVKANTQAK